MSLDLGPALRAAFLNQQDATLQALAESIVDRLGKVDEVDPSLFAFRPVPDDALDPMILINAQVSVTEADAIRSERPIVIADIAIYGKQGTPGDPSDQSPIVEAIAFDVRKLFHRQRFAVQPDGYSVIDIRATGPVPAPTDDDGEMGRVVTLTIRLRSI